ncbi:MAG: DNA polymerase III subunit epsilon [Desulfobulbus propionicus]|nr:MAG: DNA polymerase III subunit epsilon [Desulfobulbus propionicus]
MVAEKVVVFDIETTGLLPGDGGRPIEIGAVLIDHGMIVDSFQSLMNPGIMISSWIESLTGISNQDIQQAPPCEEVIRDFLLFTGELPLVAHNAAYDISFLDAEMEALCLHRVNPSICTLALSRKLIVGAPNYKLKTLVEYGEIVSGPTYHRALEDAEKTGLLWLVILDELKERYGIHEPAFPLMQQIAAMKKRSLKKFLAAQGGKQT